MVGSDYDMGITKPQFKGNLGMFLVCAELSKRNLIAMPTSRNTKGYDIVVLNPETNVALGIQVKCTDRKEFPVLTSHWKDYVQRIEGAILSDFVFVDISDSHKPNFFILSEKETKNLLKAVFDEYLQKYQQRCHLTWEQMLEKEEREKRKPDLWVIRLSHVEGYQDKWDTITNSLKGLAA